MNDRRKSARLEPLQLTSAEFAKLSFSKKLALITIRRAQISSRHAVKALGPENTGRG